jgi:hypothetical protein
MSNLRKFYQKYSVTHQGYLKAISAYAASCLPFHTITEFHKLIFVIGHKYSTLNHKTLGALIFSDTTVGNILFLCDMKKA